LQEIIKLRAEINQRNKKKYTKNQPNQELVLEKINRIYKPLARLTRGHRDSIKLTKSEMKRRHNNRNQGGKNKTKHQILLQTPILNTPGKPG
jgi:pantothenate kinase